MADGPDVDGYLRRAREAKENAQIIRRQQMSNARADLEKHCDSLREALSSGSDQNALVSTMYALGELGTCVGIILEMLEEKK